jgi:Protein of unknown function (DUF3501).
MFRVRTRCYVTPTVYEDMRKITQKDLCSLEQYAVERSDFRNQVMAHKKNRRLPIGPNATLYFEDTLTISYQIQEMLRIERLFEADAIQEEIDAYNPLIPDGRNWKATFMIEYGDETERRRQLGKMMGIETAVWLRVVNGEKIVPITDEDLERTEEDKTSSVHFLRFELTAGMIAALRQGARLAAGIDHPAYTYTIDPVPENIRQALIADLD